MTSDLWLAPTKDLAELIGDRATDIIVGLARGFLERFNNEKVERAEFKRTIEELVCLIEKYGIDKAIAGRPWPPQ